MVMVVAMVVAVGSIILFDSLQAQMGFEFLLIEILVVDNLRIQLVRVRVLRDQLVPIERVPVPPAENVLLEVRLPRPQVERVDPLVAVAGGLEERVPPPRNLLVGRGVGEDVLHVGVEEVPCEADEGEGDEGREGDEGVLDAEVVDEEDERG